MRYGFWLPVFGGWLRNIDDESMPATWPYVRDLALRAEAIGFDLTLIAELNLNDIKGPEADSLDAWSTDRCSGRRDIKARAHGRRPPHLPLPCPARQAGRQRSTVSRGGRLTLNVVSSWWRDEATRYGLPFDEHDDRYARTSEWLDVVSGCWREQNFSHSGKLYNVAENLLSPKPLASPRRPTLYAGGESETAKNLIAAKCDAYLMHGDDPSTPSPPKSPTCAPAAPFIPHLPPLDLRRHRLLHPPRLRRRS